MRSSNRANALWRDFSPEEACGEHDGTIQHERSPSVWFERISKSNARLRYRRRLYCVSETGASMSDHSDLKEEFDFEGELPPTLDRAAIDRMRTIARVFDDFMRIPGTDFRIGLDPILGALPGVGDVISAGLSLYLVLEAARLGVSFTTLLRMIANVSIDVVGGSLPIVGGIIDAVWKANKRNIELVLEDLAHDPLDDDFDEPEVVEIEIE
jgi:hypothetical protein